MDWEGIPPTVDWWREVEKGIEEADVFLFLISPDSAASKVCGQEIDHAVKNGKRLIPLVVRDIKEDEAPKQLGHLNWIFFRESDDFGTSLKKLLEGIHTDYEWVQSHRRLQVKALEWERNSKENSFLLRGRDLQDAELQLATNTSKEPYPTDLQREYVFKSRQAADYQRRLVTGISVVGVIALAVLAVFGFVQANLATENANKAQAASTLAVSNEATAIANEQEAKRQAQVSLSRQLAAQAQNIKLRLIQNSLFLFCLQCNP
ncbi:MAG: toll/interleukin-1 receptor domain-containing protein [Anaerolineales bacterium]|nr:toll/interleukin-1 receptor domain-containing protein [Anaerolineales bacterium]